MDPFVSAMLEDETFDLFDEETRREVEDYYDDSSDSDNYSQSYDY